MNDKGIKEEQLTLELLDAIDRQNDVSQRHLAQQMGVALGLANSYLKRCIRKGYIKMSQAPANRYLYYLTPMGFAEKSRLTASYFKYSFSFYREAGDSCKQAFLKAKSNGWNNIILCGISDLAEIAALRAMEVGINIIGIYDPDSGCRYVVNIPVSNKLDDLDGDAYLLTSLTNQEIIYKILLKKIAQERILVPDIISINRIDTR